MNTEQIISKSQTNFKVEINVPNNYSTFNVDCIATNRFNSLVTSVSQFTLNDHLAMPHEPIVFKMIDDTLNYTSTILKVLLIHNFQILLTIFGDNNTIYDSYLLNHCRIISIVHTGLDRIVTLEKTAIYKLITIEYSHVQHTYS